jgi:carotenoid cleavage dioxygenase
MIKITLKISPYRPTPYLEDDLYRPVEGNADVASLAVTAGRIPPELQGAYARVGPNPRVKPLGRYHWFDGSGMVHAVVLRDGMASYVRRYVETAAFHREEQAGRALTTGLIEPLSLPNIKNYLVHRRFLASTGNTALLPDGDSVVATHYLGTEAYRLDASSFTTRGRVRFPDRRLAICAHPKRDPESGNLLFFSGSPKSIDKAVVEVGADGRVVAQSGFQIRQPFLMHDFAFTRRYFVVFDLPTDPTSPPEESLHHIRANRRLPGRIGLIARGRDEAPTRWFEVDPGVVLHTVNAYEQSDTIVVHAIAFRDNTFGGHMHEWRLDLASGAVQQQALDDELGEFPRINDGRLGIRYRYAYMPKVAPMATFGFDRLIKYDLQTGETTSASFGSQRYGSEPVFVPRANARDEDDGYVMTLITDAATKRGELLVMDAQTLETAARVEIPMRVPIGFHAAYVPH